MIKRNLLLDLSPRLCNTWRIYGSCYFHACQCWQKTQTLERSEFLPLRTDGISPAKTTDCFKNIWLRWQHTADSKQLARKRPISSCVMESARTFLPLDEVQLRLCYCLDQHSCPKIFFSAVALIKTGQTAWRQNRTWYSLSVVCHLELRSWHVSLTRERYVNILDVLHVLLRILFWSFNTTLNCCTMNVYLQNVKIEKYTVRTLRLQVRLQDLKPIK